MIKHRQIHRRGRRSHMTVRSVMDYTGYQLLVLVRGSYVSCTGAHSPVCVVDMLTPCMCLHVRSYTDPQVSMDLLRAVLQPSFNDDIMAVFKKYHKVRGHTWSTGVGQTDVFLVVCQLNT